MSDTKLFAIGDAVWVYETSLWPIEATITKVIGFSDDDGVLGYEVLQKESMSMDGRCIASHRVWARPSARTQLLKQLHDDIEFLGTCAREIEAGPYADISQDQS